MNKLTHLNESGKANMVDVGEKPNQIRIAKATGSILLKKETIQLITDNQIKKGAVLHVAEIAGILAAKKTHELIPLCHNLLLSKVDVETEIKADRITITAEARCIGQTGVEMEALTAVSVALLTIYDMCKAVDKLMTITDVQLLEKNKSDL